MKNIERDRKIKVEARYAETYFYHFRKQEILNAQSHKIRSFGVDGESLINWLRSLNP